MSLFRRRRPGPAWDKNDLAEKLIEYPLLRLLLYSTAFRRMLILLVLGGVATALCLPKIWRTTPAGFEPAVQVSVLDLVQSWSLARSARKHHAAGRIEDAIHAWRSAVANNLASDRHCRKLIECVLESPQRSRYAALVAAEVPWLLRLTRTNQADLEFGVRVFEQYRFFGAIAAYLGAQADRLTPALARSYLAALFSSGQMAEFDRRYGQYRELAGEDPEVRLYRAAYVVGGGPVPETAASRAELEAARNDPAREILAHRLIMAVSLRREEVEACGNSLEQLAARKEDTTLDHVNYWRLLVKAGRKDEAVQRAQAFLPSPTNQAEAERLLRIYSLLGLNDIALELVNIELPKYPQSVELWMAKGALLIERGEWERVADLAAQIRQVASQFKIMAGYSYFLEGRAALAQKRPLDAERAFRRLPDMGISHLGLALFVAENVWQAGYGSDARALLERMRQDFAGQPEYWRLLVRMARVDRDAALYLAAAESLYRLAPEDVFANSNYAAALVIHGQRVNEALGIAFLVRNRVPESLAFQILHARALTLNQRHEEAEEILNRIDPARLTAEDASTYHLARAQLEAAQGRLDQARASARSANSIHLFEPETRWLDELEKPPRADTAPANAAG